VIVKIARWSDGNWEYRVKISDTLSEEYLQWIKEMGGDDEYNYDKGIAP